MLCDLKIQFERHMNEGKYHLAEPLVTAIAALNKSEGLYRYGASSGPPSSDCGRVVTLCLLTGKLRS